MSFLKRIGNNHYNGLLRSGELEIPLDGDCLFRAVINGLHRGQVRDELAEDRYISELRDHVATYISHHWDALSIYVVPDSESARDASEPQLLAVSRSPFRPFLPPSSKPGIEASTQAVGGEAQLHRLMADILQQPLQRRFEILVTPHMLPVVLAPAIDPLRSCVVTERELYVPAMTLWQINDAIAHSPIAP